MSEWREERLADIALVNPTERITKGEVAKKIAMEELQPFTKRISSYSYEEYKGGTKFRNGDTLIARITPSLENGKTAKVDVLEDGEIGFGSTEFIVLREIEGRSYSDFLYYFSISPDFREMAIQSMTGTSGRQRVQTEVVENHSFLLPPLPEQKAIAEVLSSLDDKTDLLHRQNETLEAMAETLFRQWFIEEAEEDWEEIEITELFEIRDGTHDSPKKKEMGKPLITTKHLNNGTIDLESAYLISEEDFEKVNQRSKVDTSDILFSMIGTVGLVYFEQAESINYAIKNLGLFKTSQNPRWGYFTYLWIKSDLGAEFIHQHKSGSTQQYISLGSLRSIVFKTPNRSLIDDFNSLVEALFKKVKDNSTQIKTLKKIRDTLLPKLMSGEVKVYG